jgi:hypothetical protein
VLVGEEDHNCRVTFLIQSTLNYLGTQIKYKNILSSIVIIFLFIDLYSEKNKDSFYFTLFIY